MFRKCESKKKARIIPLKEEEEKLESKIMNTKLIQEKIQKKADDSNSNTDYHHSVTRKCKWRSTPLHQHVDLSFIDINNLSKSIKDDEINRNTTKIVKNKFHHMVISTTY